MEKITLKNTRGDTHIVEVKSYADVSDGYHTIEELYDHRITLWIALLRLMPYGMHRIWRSKLHYDGTGYDGWFVLGLHVYPGKQITYHIPLSRWEETNFAETYEKAPCEFDGHSSADVLERLKRL